MPENNNKTKTSTTTATAKAKVKTGSLNPIEERLCNNPVGCSDFVSKQLLMNLGYNQTNKKEFDEALQAFKKTTGTHDDAWRIFGHIKQNKGEITYQNIDNTAKVDNLKKSKIKVGDVIALRNNTGQSSYQSIADANNLYDKKAKNVNSHVGYVSNIDENGNIYVDHYLGDNKYRRDILKNDKGTYKLWKTDHTNKYTGEQGYFGEYDVVGIARPNVDNFKTQYADQLKKKAEIKKRYESYKLPESINNYKTDNKKVQAAFEDFKKNYKVYGEITGLAPDQLEKLFYVTLGQAEQETKSGKDDISENIYATNIGIPVVKAASVGLDSIVKTFKNAVNTVSGNKPLLPAWKRQILIDKDIEQGLIPKDKIKDKEYIEQYISDRPDKFGLLDDTAKEYTPPSRGWLRAKYISPEADNLGISSDAIVNKPDKAFVNSLLINSDNYYSLKNIYKDKYSDDELIALTTNSYNSSLSKNKEYVDHFLPRQKIDYTNKVYSHIKDLYGVNMPNYNYVEKEGRKTQVKPTQQLAKPEFKMNNKYAMGGNLDFYTNQIAQEDAMKQMLLNTVMSQVGNTKQGLTKAATMGIFGNGGKLTEYKGNTHESGGIPIGNNEVEHGETNHNGYIFSDRLMVGKKSFAQLSKDINKRYSKRPDDKISIQAKERELNNLTQLQESTGMTNKSNGSYANGGYYMNLINKMNKYNDVKRQNDIGGNEPFYPTPTGEAPYMGEYPLVTLGDINETGFNKNKFTLTPGVGVKKQFQTPGAFNIKTSFGNIDNVQKQPGAFDVKLPTTDLEASKFIGETKSKYNYNPSVSNNKLYEMDQVSPWWLAASNVGNIANLAMSRPSKVSLDRVKPNLVDPYRSNTILRNELRTQANQSNQDIRGTANTVGTFLAASVNNTARNNNIIGSKIAQSNLEALNTNAQILNNNSAQNAQIQMAEQDLNQREKDASKTIKSNAISSMGNNVMQYGLDRANVNMTNKMIPYIAPQGYEHVENPDGTISLQKKKGSGSIAITLKPIGSK